MSIYVTLPQENTTKLSPDHHRHCCEERGLDEQWIKASCESADMKEEASEYLHYKSKSPGILIKGANGQYQFRPDKPWANKRGQRDPAVKRRGFL